MCIQLMRNRNQGKKRAPCHNKTFLYLLFLLAFRNMENFSKTYEISILCQLLEFWGIQFIFAFWSNISSLMSFLSLASIYELGGENYGSFIIGDVAIKGWVCRLQVRWWTLRKRPRVSPLSLYHKQVPMVQVSSTAWATKWPTIPEYSQTPVCRCLKQPKLFAASLNADLGHFPDT